jgi:hypothetical protein
VDPLVLNLSLLGNQIRSGWNYSAIIEFFLKPFACTYWKLEYFSSQDFPGERKQWITQKIGWDATSVATASDEWRIRAKKQEKKWNNVEFLHHLILPFEIRQQFQWRLGQACRIRMTNHPEEKMILVDCSTLRSWWSTTMWNVWKSFDIWGFAR